ncbi:hypothetical protein F2P81_014912 [Scophthalmus maximus]|uniref:Jupiter microtubule associated homolog 1b n=1 Tax=Scophthalmus maximus TaxID=52904 RepID=A0A6A4SQL2_SCOMX|nr:hypothetical protein F2P81_014912 [Scophthalmus maximus]
MFFSDGWSRLLVASLQERRRQPSLLSLSHSLVGAARLTDALLEDDDDDHLQGNGTRREEQLQGGVCCQAAKSFSPCRNPCGKHELILSGPGRVLRPPGGESSFSLGTDENGTPQRKNKMASSIFAEPDDPHAHRRNNPPTGAAAGTLCGEPSAPLRRCQQPLLFPKNPQPELTTIHNSGAAMVWGQRQEVENGQEVNDECPDDAEVQHEEQEQQKEAPQPSAPSGDAMVTPGGRRNPPGGKSSLILG